uniref:Putative secreted protein n=1 Tax=Ixodes ricinus TaxID=34613 RepID=A0A090XER6_IXORI
MALNVFTLLQLVFLAAITFNANLHSIAAESETSTNRDSGKPIEVQFCETNCTEENGVWVGCTDNCTCVHVGNCTEGRCMEWGGGDYEDYTTLEAED